MAGLGRITGLTGLEAARHPHQVLKVLYEKINMTLQKMPAEAGYRKHTEAVISERMALVQSETDVEQLERKVNNGLVEQLILQARRELSLSRKMLQWRPWEPLIGQAPPNQWKWPL
ncbi:NADH dehydrogenase [ubiquinone] 1 alpha subcomplex subunit 5 [Patella vulgata]|uniref:NADH dehydrogenase [ubiquinone] 1 alpha subcomplex subunit 5 n=1 Tax=Patella vulgata TaxID=6465 RepID=UPI00217FE42E|nr:NADH dehydrogenase [ubiquinone] 1 alpha subcomplex subunit 5 [Patella vulgata]